MCQEIETELIHRSGRHHSRSRRLPAKVCNHDEKAEFVDTVHHFFGDGSDVDVASR